jgi:Flp pilus assembly protein TadD
MQTRRGLEIGTDDPDAVAAADDFTDRLARIATGVEAIVPAAERHPQVASLQLYAALLWLYAQTDDATRTAAAYLERAAAVESSNEREQAMLAGLRCWRDGDYLAGVEVFEQLTRTWPTDLAAVKALEFLYFVLGQQHNGARAYAHFGALAERNAGDPDFLATLAFAAELSGHADVAADLVEQALAIETDLPWAHHAYAHLMIGRGSPDEALRRLTGYLPLWTHDGQFAHAHNSWHLALVHLDHLDLDGALDLYDRHIWGFNPDLPVEQVDAISLLWRVELGGWGVDDARWEAVARHVDLRTGECYHPFLSAHHAYALARSGHLDALEALLATVDRRTAGDDDEARRVWRPVGRAVVEAAAAHGLGNLRRSASLLDPVMGSLTAIGGSDAQDDLFRQAYLAALIGAGRTTDAQTYWKTMTGWKTTSPLDEQWLERL